MDFLGLHLKDECILSAHQQQIFHKIVPAELFPEYYIINVNNFDDVAKNSLDECLVSAGKFIFFSSLIRKRQGQGLRSF